MSQDVVKDWLSITGRHAVLPESEVLGLAKIIQNPTSEERAKTAARNKLIKHNLKIVAKITLNYLNRRVKFRLSDDRILDYLQQGTLGLIKAVEKYDPSKGYKFSTYAHNWIRAYIGRYHYANYCLVHIPENVMCAMLNENKPELQKFIDCAAQFKNMDSLDRTVLNSNNEEVRLGDIVAEALYA